MSSLTVVCRIEVLQDVLAAAQHYAHRVSCIMTLALTSRGWQGAIAACFLFLVLFVGLAYWLVAYMGLGCLPG